MLYYVLYLNLILTKFLILKCQNKVNGVVLCKAVSVVITSENIRLVTLVSNVFKYYDTSVALFTKHPDRPGSGGSN